MTCLKKTRQCFTGWLVEIFVFVLFFLPSVKSLQNTDVNMEISKKQNRIQTGCVQWIIINIADYLGQFIAKNSFQKAM